MRLIRIGEGRHPGADSGHEVRVPDDWLEADALFTRGLRALRARDDELALRIFELLCCYQGDAPPGLIQSARAVRDFLDPDWAPEEKAEAIFGFFSRTGFRVYDAEKE